MKKRYIVAGAIVVILLLVGVFRLRQQPKTTNAVANIASDTPLKSVPVDKQFSFGMLDANGKEVSKISFTITSAELRNTIVIRGQTATAVPGRVFLIFNIKLRNDSNSRIQLVTGDYIRLSVNGGDDWLAAEITNDPVIVESISTKYTRLGFPISLTDKEYKLRVGEIKGEKQILPVNF